MGSNWKTDKKKLNEVLVRIEKIDFSLSKEAQRRLDNLTKPKGSLGRLEEIAKKVVCITGDFQPMGKNKVVFVMAADHGVAEENVSAYPQEVTAQMVYNFLRGGAGINVLSRHIGVKVVVVDMGVKEKLKVKNDKLKIRKINYGTKNITKGPAMKKSEAIKSLNVGIEVFEEEYKKSKVDLVAVGEMGIANTTSSSAITAVICKKAVEEVAGRGTGVDDLTLKNKIKVIKKALKLNKPDSEDGIDVLSKVGGFEIGGMAGVILGAVSKRIPVVIDGFISSAGALIASVLEPKIKDYLFAGHISEEKGHKVILEYLGLKPILDLNLRLGEGTGAVLAMNIIEAGIKILNEMATFEEAGVSEEK